MLQYLSKALDDWRLEGSDVSAGGIVVVVCDHHTLSRKKPVIT